MFIGLKNDVWLRVAGIESLGLSYEMVSLCISEMMKIVEARSKAPVVGSPIVFSGNAPLLGHSQPRFGQNDTIALDYGIILRSQLLIGV